MPRKVLGTWIKGAWRRPSRAAAVILTLTIMTVGVVGALVAADTLEQLFVADARAIWGEVDVEVTSAERATFETSFARTLGTEATGESPAWAPRLILRSVVEASERRVPDAVLMGVGPEEQSFASASGAVQDVLRLGTDEVVVNERAAERLDVEAGADLTMIVQVPELLLDQPGTDIPLRRPPEAVEFRPRVAAVVPDTGVADFGRTANVLMRRDALQDLVDLEDQVTHLHMASDGDADDLIRVISPLLRLEDLVAAPVLEDALEIADDEGGQFRSILLMLAVLVIAAAAIAASQMLIALTEDRSREIGVLRTFGATGKTIIRLVTFESVAYAVVAVIAGSLLALPVANALASQLSDHFASLSAGRGREQVALLPVIDPGTLVVGILIVAGAAVWAGRTAGRRLAIVDLDELLRGPLVRLPEAPLSPRRPIVVGMLGSLILGTGLVGGDASDALRYMGVTLVLTAWWLHHRRRAVDRALLDRRVALAGLAWATLGAGALADFSQGYETGFGILVIAGVITITAITVLLAGRFRSVMGWIRAYAPRGRWQVGLRTAGAYADASRGRSGRLMATFGILLFMVATLEVLGSATAVDTSRQSGGFDVLARSTVGMENLDLGEIGGWDGGVALPSTFVPEDRFGAVAEEGDVEDAVHLRYPVRMIGVTPELVTEQGFGLAEASPGYDSAAEVLDAVMTDRTKAVVDRYARPPGADIGDDVVIDLGLGPRRYELVGVLDTFLLGGVFVSPDEYVDLVASSGSTLLLGRAVGGVPPHSLAVAVESWGHAIGVDASTMDRVASDIVSVNRTFTDTFALMLLFGLGVALVAVAATLVRSGRERRPYLALLRAIGLRPGTVALALASEPVSVALVGGLAGVAGGLLVLRLLFAVGFSDLAFVVDWQRLGIVVAAVATILGALCLAVARASVPRDPGEALREVG